jgi:hypothetical protein
MPTCGIWVYDAVTTINGLIDSSIFRFDSATKILTFQTNDRSKVGTYTIKIRGYQ